MLAYSVLGNMYSFYAAGVINYEYRHMWARHQHFTFAVRACKEARVLLGEYEDTTENSYEVG